MRRRRVNVAVTLRQALRCRIKTHYRFVCPMCGAVKPPLSTTATNSDIPLQIELRGEPRRTVKLF